MIKSTLKIRRPTFAGAMLALACLALCALFADCAYYNMLYNARSKYREAEKLPRANDGTITRQQTNLYDEVADKCEKVIETYPDSRWVDDAFLLMARARYGQDNFQAAIAKIDELEERFPKSHLLEKARFLKGKSYADWGKDEEAVETLTRFIDTYPKSDLLDQALYRAALSGMKLENEEIAMAQLERLGREFPKSQYKLDADIEMAEILLEKGQYDRCLVIYERLASERLAMVNRYRVWSRLARVYNRVGRFEDALELTERIRLLIRDSSDAVQKAETELLAAESYVGVDSLDLAIDAYKGVAAGFKKSKYSAEAEFRIGALYQGLDSLEVAKRHFDEVQRQFARSEFADEAIKRSSNISKLITLRENADAESPEAMALRQFSLAEVQLFQFEDVDKALKDYNNLLEEFPQSQLAPKAAYAIGYIYGVVRRDSVKAYEWYRYLVEHYPGTQQAFNAELFYAPAADDTTTLTRMRNAAPWVPASQAADSSRAVGSSGAADSTQAADSTRVVGSTQAADSARVVDSTQAADSTRAADSVRSVDSSQAADSSRAAADSSQTDEEE